MIRSLDAPNPRARWIDLVMIREDVDEVSEAAIRQRAREAWLWLAFSAALLFGALIGDGYVTHERMQAAADRQVIGRAM